MFCCFSSKYAKWLMLLCLVGLGLLIFWGRSSQWVIVAAMGLCVLSHIWMMRQGSHHDKTNDNASDASAKDKNQDNSQSHGCH